MKDEARGCERQYGFGKARGRIADMESGYGVEGSRFEGREGSVLSYRYDRRRVQRRACWGTWLISPVRQLGRSHVKFVSGEAVVKDEEDERPRPRGLSRREGRR